MSVPTVTLTPEAFALMGPECHNVIFFLVCHPVSPVFGFTEVPTFHKLLILSPISIPKAKAPITSLVACSLRIGIAKAPAP